MSRILEALLDGLFDYAGMFPPASLSFEDTLKNSAGFLASLRRPYLLGGDIVLDQTKLSLLTPAAISQAGFQRSPLRVCLLGQPLTDSNRIFSALPGAGCRIVSYEVKLPWPFAGFPQSAADAIAKIRRSLERSIQLFVEPELSPADWENKLEAVFGLFDIINKPDPRAVGLKIRGSGPKAITNAVLSRLLPEVNKRGLPFKATAGLHHPLRNTKAGNDLGFLNLATAFRLQCALGSELPKNRLLECLESEDAGVFGFNKALSWKECSIPATALQAAIQRVPFSIGSCSLNDPDDDIFRLFG